MPNRRDVLMMDSPEEKERLSQKVEVEYIKTFTNQEEKNNDIINEEKMIFFQQ